MYNYILEQNSLSRLEPNDQICAYFFTSDMHIWARANADKVPQMQRLYNYNAYFDI